MRQLVGLKCAVCGERIDSVEEGRFCEACGCAVHNHRAKPDPTRSDLCPFCGAEAEVALDRQKLEVERNETHEAAQRSSVVSGYLWDGLGLLFVALGFVAFNHVIMQALALRHIIVAVGLVLYGLGLIVYGFYVLSRPKGSQVPRHNRLAVFAVAGVWFVIAEIVGYTLWHG